MDSDFDIHEARRASSYRLLDVWSHLAERHSRRLNDDDIIDVFTGEVVRDRGVLRNSFQQYDIGYFADAQAGNNNDDASSEGDKDELDVLAEQADISGELEERERLNRNVPPVQVMDPADAEDLREFLEAERKRKEIWGCEEEESSASDDLAEARNREDNLEEAGDVNDAGNGDSEEEEEEDLEHSAPQDVLGDHEIPLNDTARHHTGDIHRPTDEESDDELGTWDFDEGNIVYQVPRNEIRGDNIIESSKNSHSPDPIIISSSPQARIPNPIWMHARALKRKRVLSEDLSVDGTMDSSKEGPNMGETSTLGALDPELGMWHGPPLSTYPLLAYLFTNCCRTIPIQKSETLSFATYCKFCKTGTNTSRRTESSFPLTFEVVYAPATKIQLLPAPKSIRYQLQLPRPTSHLLSGSPLHSGPRPPRATHNLTSGASDFLSREWWYTRSQPATVSLAPTAVTTHIPSSAVPKPPLAAIPITSPYTYGLYFIFVFPTQRSTVLIWHTQSPTPLPLHLISAPSFVSGPAFVIPTMLSRCRDACQVACEEK
jgi:hypothetical protein